MGLRIPNDAEIRAKANELGLVDSEGQLTPANRARAARAIVDDEQGDAEAAQQAGNARETVLSRSVVRVADGHLVVEVRHIADPPATT